MMNREEKIKEVQMYIIAGLSLTRAISPDDIRWAVEKGFNAGERYATLSE